jgi:DNA-binding transcriptional MerR regulator
MYYRIGEAAQLVGAKPHVLRYWESEFRAIRPTKSSKGQRVYSRRDIEVLRRIRSLLKEQGYTIEGARKKLREGGFEPVAAVEPAAAVLTEKMRATLREMRTDVADFLARLEREA